MPIKKIRWLDFAEWLGYALPGQGCECMEL